MNIDNAVVSAREFAGKWQATAALLTACTYSRMANAKLRCIIV